MVFNKGDIVQTIWRGKSYQATVVESDHLLTRVTFVAETGKVKFQTHPTTCFLHEPELKGTIRSGPDGMARVVLVKESGE